MKMKGVSKNKEETSTLTLRNIFRFWCIHDSGW